MKRQSFFYFIVAVAITVCGCKREALEVHPELSGDWYSEYYTSHGGSEIHIANGSATYKIFGSNAEAKTYSGEAKIKNDKLKIGRADLEISSYPSYDSQGNYVFVTNAGKFIGCLAVINPTATVNGTAVTFAWTRSSTFDVSEDKSIDYKPASSSSWITASCSSGVDEYTITGLSPGTIYEWRIKSVRGNHASQYSAVATFTTN
jgi:hypothetical protein